MSTSNNSHRDLIDRFLVQALPPMSQPLEAEFRGCGTCKLGKKASVNLAEEEARLASFPLLEADQQHQSKMRKKKR